MELPLHLTARSLAPALALGNAVVVKPASDTPITGGLLLARIFEEAGLPAGVLSVVVGSGAEIGDAFVEHPVPALISFTGSTQVGRNIGRIASGGEHLKHVALELGGNSPFVVLADADVEQAVNAAVVGKFLHQGQICMAINRIIVEQPLLEDFTRRFVERVKALPYGDPSKPGTVVGPVINARQLAGLKEKIATAKAEGATLLLGGEPQGNVMPPHVFGNVTADMEIAREEIFGPLVGIQSARDAEHALELANSSEYGLSSAVFTASLERGVQFARRIHAGMTHVNDIPVNDEPNAPSAARRTLASAASTATGPSRSSPPITGSPCNTARGPIRSDAAASPSPSPNKNGVRNVLTPQQPSCETATAGQPCTNLRPARRPGRRRRRRLERRRERLPENLWPLPRKQVGPVITGRQLPPQYISAVVRNGFRAMPAFPASFIDDKALQQVAEYISKTPATVAKP